jgi:hypothetical protein
VCFWVLEFVKLISCGRSIEMGRSHVYGFLRFFPFNSRVTPRFFNITVPRIFSLEIYQRSAVFSQIFLLKNHLSAVLKNRHGRHCNAL